MPACTDPTIGFTVFSEQLMVVMVMSIMLMMWMAGMINEFLDLGSSVIMPARLNTKIQLCNGFIVFSEQIHQLR